MGTFHAASRAIADVLRGQVEEAALMMTRESGKPLAEARGEFGAAIDQFDWYADEARRIFGHTLGGRDPGARLDVQYRAVGPVAAFTAWNFPALLPARKIAAASPPAARWCVKPSEETPSNAFLFAEAARHVGLSKGVLGVVTGDPAEISRYLIASPVIRKVSLTGSVPVGKMIMKLCADGLKRLSLELGGHAPVLVFPDADPVSAGKACAAAKIQEQWAGMYFADPLLRARIDQGRVCRGYGRERQSAEAGQRRRSERDMRSHDQRTRTRAGRDAGAGCSAARSTGARRRRPTGGRSIAAISSSRPCSTMCPTMHE